MKKILIAGYIPGIDEIIKDYLPDCEIEFVDEKEYEINVVTDKDIPFDQILNFNKKRTKQNKEGNIPCPKPYKKKWK